MITAVQILQMMVYVVVNAAAAYYYYTPTAGDISETEGGKCSIRPLNLNINAIVTVSYLVLFSSFFIQRYLQPRKAQHGEKREGANGNGKSSKKQQ